jgi:ribonuclease P protein component
VPEPAPPLRTILKRRDFLAAARARRWAAPALVLQARRRRADEPEAEAIRVGYTCSKKVGGAVVRNRAKRRLRAAAGATLPRLGRAGWDYVLIGREGATVARPFAALLADLEAALARVHAAPKPRAPAPDAAAPDAPAP